MEGLECINLENALKVQNEAWQALPLRQGCGNWSSNLRLREDIRNVKRLNKFLLDDEGHNKHPALDTHHEQERRRQRNGRA